MTPDADEHPYNQWEAVGSDGTVVYECGVCEEVHETYLEARECCAFDD